MSKVDHSFFTSVSYEIRCIFSTDGIIQHACDKFANLLGRESRTLIGVSVYDLTRDEDTPETNRCFESATNTGKTTPLCNRFLSTSGYFRWLQWRLRYNQDNGLIYATAYDVTDYKQCESSFKALQKATEIGVWTHDAKTGEVTWSEQMHDIHETDPNIYDLQHENNLAFYAEEGRPRLLRDIELAQQGERREGEYPFITQSGKRAWVEGKMFCDIQDGQVLRQYGTVEDVTERRADRIERQKLAQRLSLAIKASSIGVWEYDPQSQELLWDEQMCKLYDIPARFKPGSLAQWQKFLVHDDRESFFHSVNKTINDNVISECIFRVKIKSGEFRYIKAITKQFKDETNNISYVLGINWDVSEHYLNQEKMRQLAEFDQLTGVASRLRFQAHLNKALQRSEAESLALSILYLDIDGFKELNDSLGHVGGDAILIEFAKRLSFLTSERGVIARFGGDEFVILLSNGETSQEVEHFAAELIACMLVPFNIEEKKVSLSTSIGIARGDPEESIAETLIKRADLALYECKRTGKNQYKVFDEALEQVVQRRRRLVQQLRSGLENEQFILHFQALKDSHKGKIIGFEALIRFIDENGKLVPPDEFISILEETNMIVDVGKWVIEQSCRQIADWTSNAQFADSAYIAVNISAKQLVEDDFITHIQDTLNKHKVKPASLVMEMTESLLIDKPEQVREVLLEAKRIGLRIALDDFGTGYSSLSYLNNFPLDIIKIDKSFIWQMSKHRNNIKIVNAIISLAKALDLLVVAEGVETEELYTQLADMGIDIQQGYLISKPLPKDEAISLYQ